jgi:hypothetical protein
MRGKSTIILQKTGIYQNFVPACSKNTGKVKTPCSPPVSHFLIYS